MDSTWDFLFNSRTGYCTNFATAYVILARLNGIPARYATGFLVFLPFDDGRTVVTGYSSHAWPEVWLPERGWVSREATPPMNPDYMQDFRNYGGPEGRMDEATRGQLDAMLGERAPPAEEEEPRGKSVKKLLFLLPLLAGLAVAAALLMLRRHLALLLPGNDPRLRAERELRRILRALKQPEALSPLRAGWQGLGRRDLTRTPGSTGKADTQGEQNSPQGLFRPSAPGTPGPGVSQAGGETAAPLSGQFPQPLYKEELILLHYTLQGFEILFPFGIGA